MNHPISRSAGPADYALLVLLATIWGASFLLIKISVGDLPPLTVTMLRLATATLVMLPLLWISGQAIKVGWRTWAFIVVTGMIGNAIPFFLINWGQAAIDSGLSAILMGVMPLITYVLAHIFTHDEKLNVWKAAGVALGLAGIVVLIGPDKLLTLGQETVSQLAVAAAAACYGINALLVRRLGGQPPLALVATFMLVSLLAVLPVCLWLERPWTLSPRVEAVAAVAVLGVVQTALATLLMLAIIRRQGASFFSQINFLVPLIGVGWGMLVLAERPSAHALMALALVLSGIGLARLGSPRPASLRKDHSARAS